MVKVQLSNLFLERRDARRKIHCSLGAGAPLAPRTRQRISLGSENDWKFRLRSSQWFTLAPFACKGRWRNFHVFGALSSEVNFNTFFQLLALFFFAMQLALVSMITITLTLSLSVFSLQRTRLFRTSGELWRTRGEPWLYFEMQRRLDLWSFSWSSRRSREAQKSA